MIGIRRKNYSADSVDRPIVCHVPLCVSKMRHGVKQSRLSVKVVFLL